MARTKMSVGKTSGKTVRKLPRKSLIVRVLKKDLSGVDERSVAIKKSGSRSAPATDGKKERRPHRFKPGVRAFKDIKRQAKTVKFRFVRKPLRDAVREIAPLMAEEIGAFYLKDGVRFQKAAMDLLVEETINYGVEMFQASGIAMGANWRFDKKKKKWIGHRKSVNERDMMVAQLMRNRFRDPALPQLPCVAVRLVGMDTSGRPIVEAKEGPLAVQRELGIVTIRGEPTEHRKALNRAYMDEKDHKPRGESSSHTRDADKKTTRTRKPKRARTTEDGTAEHKTDADEVPATGAAAADDDDDETEAGAAEADTAAAADVSGVEAVAAAAAAAAATEDSDADEPVDDGLTGEAPAEDAVVSARLRKRAKGSVPQEVAVSS